MIIDVKTLKRRVDSISTNISIYESDLERLLKNLKRYRINGEIPDHIKKLKEENKKLIPEEQSWLRKADRILSKVEE